MTDSEARAILELEDEATRDQIRRAYMRKLKAHPPERDPEGFQRLRMAYEHLLPPKVGGGATIAIPAVEQKPAPDEKPDEPIVVEPALVVEQPFLFFLVEQLLESLLEGNYDEAESLAARVRTGIAEDRDQLAMIGQVRWVLISELAFVARQIPTKLVRALVRALNDDDVSRVAETLQSEMKWDAAKVQDLDQYLVKRAPNLWAWATGREAVGTPSIDPLRLVIALGILGVIVALITWSQC